MIKKKVISAKQSVESILNAQQACNEFQIVRTIRAHVLKKFKNQTYSKDEWERIFKDQRVL